MASSEVDQKFLGVFARRLQDENPYLSSWLYKILGLSVRLARKLLRARKYRKLDTTRDTKSLQLYHQIIWMSREGLVMVEQYVLPMVERQRELKVLIYKLRGSFYHIFVLFHNTPTVTQASIPGFSTSSSATTPRPAGNGKGKYPAREYYGTPTSPNPMNGGPVGGNLPPGLAPISVPKPTSSFLLPAKDYIPAATQSFNEASALADRLLSGSHPIRLSVKLEYAAFMYDCLRDAEGSRLLAKQTIADVYNAPDGMDDETFEDAAELVGILGRMMKRGAGSQASPNTPGKSQVSPTTPAKSQASPKTPSKSLPSPKTPKTQPSPHASGRASPGRGSAGGRTPRRTSGGMMPAVPSPGMRNPI
ncbi:MAG: hypothetical protein M1824_001283 [Vezdaea acicularis]|nr:MAG: hypothetical protein M1824_001283 [Vezdaea acicularis]